MHPFIILTTSLIISTVHYTIAIYDGQYAGETTGTNFNQYSLEQFIRSLRNIHQQDKKPQDSAVRFGWQNPIRVAPTLRPPQRYPQPPPPPRYPLPSITTPPNTFPLMPPYKYPTTEQYKDPLIPSWSNQNNQFVRPPPGEDRPFAQPQTSGSCPDGSKRDNQSRKCMKLGSSCGENMAFYENPFNRDFGQCDCVQNVTRPLVYHAETGKCYFVFQQAYCSESEWLIVEPLPNSRPRCSRNTCMQWTRNEKPNWSWTNNDLMLDQRGPVALLNERICSMLGSSCKQEGNQQLSTIISQTRLENGVSLRFVGNQLACRRNSEISEFDVRSGKLNNNLQLTCKPGLFNKWSLDGQCRN